MRFTRRDAALTAFALLLACAVQLASSNCTTASCAATISATRSFKVGDVMQFVAYINGTGITPQRAVFYPKLDTFSMFTIAGSGLAYQGNTSVQVLVSFAEIANLTTASLPYASSTGFVAYWTVFVTLSNGVVTAVQYDPGETCATCTGTSGTVCIADKCGIEYSSLNSTTSCSTGACDMVFYVGFIGSDNTGTPLTSAGSAFSRMRAFSIGSVVNAASAWIVNQLNALNATL